MNSRSKLQPIYKNVSGVKNHKIFRKRNIIKDRVIKQHTPVKIKMNESRSFGIGEELNGFIEPIVKEGDIIGLIHKCSCGKVAEIQFEYDNVQEVASDMQPSSDTLDVNDHSSEADNSKTMNETDEEY